MKKLIFDNNEKDKMANADHSDRNYILVNEFHESAVKDFKNHFEILNRSDYPIIPIYVDSFGGEIYSALAMIDILECADKPIATIAIGKAMSAGSVLLACGSPGWRFASPNSTIMIHDAASFNCGKIEELKTSLKHVDALNDIMYGILAKKCGHKDKDYFKKIIKEKGNQDWYIDATEALKHKIVDHIGVPKFGFNFNAMVMGNGNKEPATTKAKKSTKNDKPTRKIVKSSTKKTSKK